MIFDNLDITDCWHSMNGVPKSSEYYTMNFSDSEWNRLFEELLKKINSK